MIEKQFLKECLIKGMNTKEIEKLPNVNIKYRTILHHINKMGLREFYNHKRPEYNYDYFNKIDTKEKAYILGYTLADGYINNKVIQYKCALADKCILDFIAKELNARVIVSTKLDRSKRRFPSASVNIGNSTLVKDINRLSNGTKENKTFPRIRKDLEPYMLLGFFDGDGCLTWGRRKDRNRIWQKVNFTGSYKLLYAIQKLLISLGISSALHKKGTEDCYVLEMASKKDVLNILKYMYGKEDLIVLPRKYNKYNALRLELGENEENTNDSAISCQATSHEVEGVETTGGKMGSLNNQLECPSL